MLTAESDALAKVRALARDLHTLQGRIDPASWSDERANEVRARLSSIQGHLAALQGSADDVWGGALGGLDAAIIAAAPTPDQGAAADWVRFSHQIHPAYEALVRTVAPEAAGARTLRPTNYVRNVFHVFGAMLVLTVLAWLPDRAWMIGVALSISVPAWTVEILRRHHDGLNSAMMWLFGPVAHPHERFRANSATWYASAMTILAFVAPIEAALLAAAVLGAGDPAAAVIGRRFGRTPIRYGRTLEGSLGFVVVGGLAGWLALAVLAPEVPSRVAVALLAAVTGAVAELFSGEVDDNLTIPLGAALGASLLL